MKVVEKYVNEEYFMKFICFFSSYGDLIFLVCWMEYGNEIVKIKDIFDKVNIF